MTPAPLSKVLRDAARLFTAKDTLTMGAALAYYAVFSLAPLLLVALWVAGLAFGEEAAQGRVADQLAGTVGPTAARAVEDVLRSAGQAGGAASSLVGLSLLVFGALGV